MGDVIDIQASIEKLIDEVADKESDPGFAEAKVLTDALSVFRDFRSIRDDGLRAAIGQIVAFLASASADRDLASARSSSDKKSKAPEVRSCYRSRLPLTANFCHWRMQKKARHLERRAYSLIITVC